MDIIKKISEELNVKEEYVQNVVNLIDEGNTIPFIARYRKEMHGALDDTTLRNLNERLDYLRSLEERRESIVNSITEQGKMTDELMAEIAEAETLARLEDLYRPYKQKRRTKATIAKEKGLGPLADAIFAQDLNSPSPEELAADYVDAEKGVETIEDALQGANDIIAEMISHDASIRDTLRDFIKRTAVNNSNLTAVPVARVQTKSHLTLDGRLH